MEQESLKLMRHSLGLLDLSDVEGQKDLTPAERKEYCASISAIWPRLKKDIEKYLYQQLLFSSNQAETWEQVLVGRGAFAGMEMLFQHWQAAHQEHVADLSFDDFEKFNSISEV